MYVHFAHSCFWSSSKYFILKLYPAKASHRTCLRLRKIWVYTLFYLQAIKRKSQNRKKTKVNTCWGFYYIYMQTYAQAHTSYDAGPDSWMDMWTGSAAAETYVSNLSMWEPVTFLWHQIRWRETYLVLAHLDFSVSMYATEVKKTQKFSPLLFGLHAILLITRINNLSYTEVIQPTALLKITVFERNFTFP